MDCSKVSICYLRFAFSNLTPVGLPAELLGVDCDGALFSGTNPSDLGFNQWTNGNAGWLPSELFSGVDFSFAGFHNTALFGGADLAEIADARGFIRGALRAAQRSENQTRKNPDNCDDH